VKISHPRFPSLAAAVRAGIQLVPDPAPPRRYFGVSADTGRLGCDALAAAWFAEYFDVERISEDEHAGLARYLSSPLAEAYPVLKRDVGPSCPLGAHERCPRPEGGRTVESKVIHLEDEHGYKREAIAEWLQSHGF